MVIIQLAQPGEMGEDAVSEVDAADNKGNQYAERTRGNQSHGTIF